MDQSTIEHYTSKLECFRLIDREREELITEALRKYDALLTEYKRKCDDYENEMESRRMWQQKELLARNEVKESRYARVSESVFRLVMITGVWDKIHRSHGPGDLVPRTSALPGQLCMSQGSMPDFSVDTPNWELSCCPPLSVRGVHCFVVHGVSPDRVLCCIFRG